MIRHFLLFLTIIVVVSIAAFTVEKIGQLN